ncbi:acyltransferase family protein [Bacillus sp. FJAT-49736]|uniref:acyltransferase family protein n=1 Tax=Bacillus sp. FJAT-49736 TaxID=2833582 RepID=UPI001BC9BB24|nr:acyltransferase family protein [Bacillus sp. FJAT-49736]MBS4174684.1 acyltransferase family protein [Bacillus sp. FJAT-49736]
MNNRLLYLDRLRVFLTFLLLFHHTAIAYGASGSWIYIDAEQGTTLTNILLSLFTAINQAFFMGLFFFLSGYFVPRSYERKGNVKFLKDRFIRLGIPLLFYLFIIGPLIEYFLYVEKSMSLGEFYSKEILTFHQFFIGPLWFVEALLIFNLIYALYKKLVRKEWKPQPFPTNRKLVITAFSLGAVAFFVRLIYPVGNGILGLQFGYFPSYILLFYVGIVSYRNNWLKNITADTEKIWKWITFIAIPIFPIGLILTGALNGTLMVNGGWNIQAILYALWEPFVCIGMCILLISLFKQKYNQMSLFFKWLADNSFTVYILHPPIIVGGSLLLHTLDILPFGKFVIVSILSLVLTFILAYLVRLIPGTRRVLG